MISFYFCLYLILHACAARFDVIENFKIFLDRPRSVQSSKGIGRLTPTLRKMTHACRLTELKQKPRCWLRDYLVAHSGHRGSSGTTQKQKYSFVISTSITWAHGKGSCGPAVRTESRVSQTPAQNFPASGSLRVYSARISWLMAHDCSAWNT